MRTEQAAVSVLTVMNVSSMKMGGTHTRGINIVSTEQLNIAELPELRRNS
jgi:hypothetical protein